MEMQVSIFFFTYFYFAITIQGYILQFLLLFGPSYIFQFMKIHVKKGNEFLDNDIFGGHLLGK